MFEEDVRTDVQCHLPVGKVWRGTEAVLLYPVCLSEAGRAGHLARGPGTTSSLDPFQEKESGEKIGSEQQEWSGRCEDFGQQSDFW